MRTTPREFGEALKTSRLEAGATLETISERTKISMRLLGALESGEFGKLPNRVIARMFARQYLEMIGVSPAEWLPAFDRAWDRFLEASQPLAVRVTLPPKGRRLWPWVIGLLLVAVGVAAVLLVDRRHNGDNQPAMTVAPKTLVGPPVPTAATLAAAPVVPAQPPGSDSGLLVIRTTGSPCWVEVRVSGERAASRLLPAGSVWEVSAGGRSVDLMLGDAGAASIAYLGETRNPAGRRGEVLRLRLDGSQPTPSARP